MIPNAYRMFNFDLGETADAIRETVHAFSSNEFAPPAAEIDKSNQFPRDLWPKPGAPGLTGRCAHTRLAEFRDIADRRYTPQPGRLLMQGSAAEMKVNPDVRKAYLGL